MQGINKEALFDEIVNGTLDYAGIGVKFGVSDTYVRTLTSRHGLRTAYNTKRFGNGNPRPKKINTVIRDLRKKDREVEREATRQRTMRILELINEGKLSSSAIAKEVGVSRSYIGQVAAKLGVKLPDGHKVNVPVEVPCERCGKGGPERTVKWKALVSKFCSDDCRYPNRKRGPFCRHCNKDFPLDQLVRAGYKASKALGFVQQYVCRPCANARYRHYGRYTDPKDPVNIERQRRATVRYRMREKARKEYIERQAKGE